MTLTEDICIGCDVNLVTGFNWAPGASRKKDRRCRKCATARGIAWKRAHPEYERERYHRLSTRKTQDGTGFIYIVTNPAWPGLCKIGRARNPHKRIHSYNTGSPYRDYSLEHWREFTNILYIERKMHDILRHCRVKGTEWFRVHVTDAVQWINALGGYTSGAVRNIPADRA